MAEIKVIRVHITNDNLVQALKESGETKLLGIGAVEHEEKQAFHDAVKKYYIFERSLLQLVCGEEKVIVSVTMEPDRSHKAFTQSVGLKVKKKRGWIDPADIVVYDLKGKVIETGGQ